ncbi:iron complex transport system substrate-binding protein [Saccharopolyspora antimicrobica]|uniref:Iron complex transport system substrate-binding protein n=1 Tax=Saccharopolyspora antimicrobica TaxID=455193 RepID=A0A1I4WPM2_9PSEU|nr:ABC transporter substrate-binding protein [Saccharopolyspora antimicrobica]RKT83014.1 iron complex transport system substrate-binding protein [Saccharopolyspora antimicrobica]SFN15761.1 iron complex transport system substrate-binding protein [Saccharopolyspora antimicrobica]
MLRPRRLLAAVTVALALGSAAACGTPASEQPAAPESGARVITHAKGQTTITGTPQRVVVLDTGELDAVLALGIKPVGTVLPDANKNLQPYLAEKAGDIEIVGTIGSPNLEKITALQPDLILSSKIRDDENYEALSKIAPTVFAETVGKTWKENFLLDADALGKKAEAQQILDAYQQRAAEIGRQVGDPGAQRISMLRFIPGDIRLYNKGSFIGTILADAGFSRPANQEADTTHTKISREQIAQADGDQLFYAAYGDSAREQMNDVVGSVQWTTLGAVRAGKAVEVSDDTWFLGLGPIAANLVLDDLQKHLAQR